MDFTLADIVILSVVVAHGSLTWLMLSCLAEAAKIAKLRIDNLEQEQPTGGEEA